MISALTGRRVSRYTTGPAVPMIIASRAVGGIAEWRWRIESCASSSSPQLRHAFSKWAALDTMGVHGVLRCFDRRHLVASRGRAVSVFER